MVKKHCSWGQCKSDSRFKDRESMKNVEFFKFQKPVLFGGKVDENSDGYRQCLQWIKLCGRPHQDLNIHKIINDYRKHNYSFYVCSKVHITF